MSAAYRLPDPDSSPLSHQRGGLTATPPARMDIHTLQRHFWKLDAEQHFSGNETRLYFYWLNLFNAEFWPEQLVRFCKQAEADLGIDAKTHARARQALQSRGLLFYLEGAKGRAAHWSLVGKIPTKKRIHRNNSDEYTAIPPQMPGNNSDESGLIPPQMPGNFSASNKEETKTSSTVETQTQKKAGAGEPDFSPSAERKKITAPNPVAAPPSPAVGSVNPCLVPGTEASRALATAMAAMWHITEGKNQRRFAQFATFTRTLNADGRLEEVRQQFEAYARYRQLRGLSPFGIEKYLGHELEGYADGEWCGCDWPALLAEAQAAKPNQSAYGPAPTPRQAAVNPSKKQNVN